MKHIAIILISISLASCTKEKKPIQIIDFNTLNSKIKSPDNKVKIYNIWATWCAPCVKELPHFNKIAKAYGDRVELNLISLDNAKELKNVERFLDRGNYIGKHYILKEKGSKWLPQFDSTWTGAIPATIVKFNDKRTFYEGAISEETLNIAIQKIINK